MRGPARRAEAPANYAGLFPDAPDAGGIAAEARAAFEGLRAMALLDAMETSWSRAGGPAAGESGQEPAADDDRAGSPVAAADLAPSSRGV